MFTSIVILLLPFLTTAFLPLTIKSFFSPADLDEMGVYLKRSEMMSSCSFQDADRNLPKMTVPCANV